MYQYICPAVGTMPMCGYCSMANGNMVQPVMPMETQPMFRGEEEFDEDRLAKGGMTPQPMQQMPGMGKQMPGMGQQMPGTGEQMPGMMDMLGMDMGKIQADTQEIVRMLEQHHPDMLNTLTNCGMSIGQARQYLASVIQMSLMHYVMHIM